MRTRERRSPESARVAPGLNSGLRHRPRPHRLCITRISWICLIINRPFDPRDQPIPLPRLAARD